MVEESGWGLQAKLREGGESFRAVLGWLVSLDLGRGAEPGGKDGSILALLRPIAASASSTMIRSNANPTCSPRFFLLHPSFLGVQGNLSGDAILLVQASSKCVVQCTGCFPPNCHAMQETLLAQEVLPWAEGAQPRLRTGGLDINCYDCNWDRVSLIGELLGVVET